MTPEIEQKLVELKHIYGPYSVTRVESMLLNEHTIDPLQRESRLILPGLSTTPWLSTSQFKPLHQLIQTLESSSSEIKSEIWSAIESNSDLLLPYVHYLGEQDDWSALYLYRNGEKNTAAKSILPASYNILENELANWLCPVSEMHFSILAPGASIKPHCDLCNFAINLHLAVDIPENCSITVAHETRQWEEGKCLLFDYSYLHEASNGSGQKRICLLMDIWHPDVSYAEREALVFVVKEFYKMMDN
ncbi:aspartyl/asparaginyl beta-hydroxylase domain-containing protein [Aliikangiella coralliicola]|uniref:Aspartyl/asparaginyl beta-hydroxylase domain-containing protein n=1 Tax=Aliikangiella coralliicola TaxID=2592383 RepID=A0A545U925_9GAMM|nr:aspartyl/asparaginyl beta-hydroxylase domain-containing protein [Aliikangiella coralliicola]TQV85976.1 aspartyl/asparaginyl beta-hydroxylase domain-containing protein [Aliikangiella coralliicola]